LQQSGRRIPGVVVCRIAAIVPPRALIYVGEVGDVARLPLHTDKLQGVEGVPRAVEILHISDVFEVIVFEIAALLRDDAFRHGAAEGKRSEEHTSELQSPYDLVCRLLLEKKKIKQQTNSY